MKELSIEEKAKRYDEAIEQLRTMMPNWENLSYNGKTFLQDLVHIIHELKESENERIRKWLIRTLKSLNNSPVQIDGAYEMMLPAIAWLEKQGEQKPTDKLEPKFKVGYWYQCTKDFFGKGVTFDKNTAYYCAKEGCLQDEYGCHIAIVKDLYNNFKLWTIQDAKDGDVLYNAEHNYILVYKHQTGTNDFVSYCRLCLNTYTFYPCEEFEWDDLIWNPSTKEQREQLEKAMTEDGYEWDADKKKLSKCIIDESKSEIDERVQPQQKQEWSEDDERIYKSITYSFVHNYPLTVQQQKFVKSLKDRVGCETNCTTTNEWSEEDEESILEICNYLDRIVREDEDNQATLLNVQELKNWLKSLRPQKHWKPTGAQLASLEIACDRNDRVGFDLTELLNGLKKYGGCSMLSQWKPSDEEIKALANALSLANNCGEESAFDLRTLYERLKKLKE